MKTYTISYRGKWLKGISSSWRGDGAEWTENVTEARMYSSEKALDKHLLQIARGCPDGGPWPDVHVFEITYVEQIDHSERFSRNRARAIKAQETFKKNWEKRRQAQAQEEIKRLEQQLKWAKERAGV